MSDVLNRIFSSSSSDANDVIWGIAYNRRANTSSMRMGVAEISGGDKLGELR